MAHGLRNIGIALALALAVTAAAPKAEAQTNGGELRIGGEATVLNAIWFPDPDLAALQLGVGSGLGVNLGYFFSDAIAIGLRFQFGFVYVDLGLGDDTQGFATFLPYFEFNFVSDQIIQGFIGAEAGYTVAGGASDGSFIAHALGGIHIFATSSFSISPTGYVGFRYDFDGEQAALDFAVTVQFLGYIDTDGSVSVTVQ